MSLAATGMFISAAGSILGGQAARRASKEARKAKEFEANVLEQQAGQEEAASQRDALEENRRAKLIASRAVALSAANGGAFDPTTVNLLADIQSEGAYRSLVAVYQGEEQARQLKLQAKVSRMEGASAERAGKAQQRASMWNAAGYLAQGGSSLYSRYGRRNPSQSRIDMDMALF